MVADLRPFVVELSSRENTQRRRVSLMASCHEEAEAIAVGQDNEYVEFRLDGDELEQARETALYVPRDSHVDGRFIRAGKVIRTRGDHSEEAIRHRRAALGLHHQETPYRVDRVGDTSLQNVLASMYGLGWQKQIEGSTGRFVWSSDTIKVALTTNTFTPVQDTQDFFNDVTNEVTGTGYTAGGATLGTLGSTYDTASDQARFTAANTTWTTSTITARNAVVYKSTGTATTSPLINYVAFGADVSTTAGTFQITWDATGVWLVDVT